MILHGIVDISLVNISLVNISLVNILIRIVSRFVRLHLEGTKRYAGVQLGYRTSPYLRIGGSTSAYCTCIGPTPGVCTHIFENIVSTKRILHYVHTYKTLCSVVGCKYSIPYYLTTEEAPAHTALA